MKETTPSADFVRGIWRENPVLVQMLGLCPALAVTNSVENALAMGLATFFVLLRLLLPRLAAQEVDPERGADLDLHPDHRHVRDDRRSVARRRSCPTVHKALGAFISLIVVNCMILGRQEAFASKRPVGRALLDAFGTGLGFIIAMVMMGGVPGDPRQRDLPRASPCSARTSSPGSS